LSSQSCFSERQLKIDSHQDMLVEVHLAKQQTQDASRASIILPINSVKWKIRLFQKCIFCCMQDVYYYLDRDMYTNAAMAFFIGACHMYTRRGLRKVNPL